MAVKPIATDSKEIAKARGSGNILPTSSYRDLDPISRYYSEFKKSPITSKYVNDDMWAEAARRGEIENLVSYLANMDENTDTSMIDKWGTYTGYNDYDAYMTALSYPYLDDQEEIEFTNEDTGEVVGKATRKKWASDLLDMSFQHYDNLIVEEQRQTLGWFQRLGADIGAGVGQFVQGTSEFIGQIYDLGEGILNIFANWSKDEDIGSRFLWAFQNNEDPESTNVFAHISSQLANDIFDFERKYTDIVTYRADAEGHYQYDYSTIGRWWTSGMQSLGYMLPSMLTGNVLGATTNLSAGTIGTIQTSLFYTGIFSGNISDTVLYAQAKGTSYKDLNAGIVVANAGLKAAAQLAIEKALGMVMGFSGLDKLMGVAKEGAAKAVSNTVSATGLKAAGIALGRGTKDMIKEGLEEVFQDLSDDIIDMAFGGYYAEQGRENLTLQNLTDAFVVGALTSGIGSAISSVKYVLPSNRFYSTNESGEAFRMGFFQTLNYKQALSTMSEWSNILSNPKAKPEAKAEAALKMSVSIDTIGSVLKTMGTDRAIKANSVLVQAMKNKDAKVSAEAKTKLSDTEYAKNLYDTFVKYNEKAATKYYQQKKDQIEKAAEKLATELKEALVQEFDSVVTKEIDTNDPNVNIDKDAGTQLKKYMEANDIDAVVGVDGNIVTKSNKVVFANKDLVKNGNIAEIIKQEAYHNVEKAVKKNLAKNQQDMILSQYEKVTGLKNATVEDAIKALLFDKSFYTQVLLLSEERHYKVQAMQMLSTIDKLVKGALAPEVTNGRLSQKAYETLLKKVQETMRTGLMTYATQYTRIDLGQVSNDILTTEQKEYIRNNRNVRFSEFIDTIKKDKSTKAPTAERIKTFDFYIDKYKTANNIDKIEQAKKDIRSNNHNDRVSAAGVLSLLVSRRSSIDADDKLVYLPLDQDMQLSDDVLNVLQTVETFFGNTYDSLANGSFDPSKIPKEAQEFMKANGYGDYMIDDRARLAALELAVYTKSNGTLTIDHNANVIQVLDKQQFLKDEYLGKKGEQKLKEDIKSGKITKVADITKAKIADVIINCPIKYDGTVTDARGFTPDRRSEVNLFANFSSDTIMHELTHVTQNLLAVDADVKVLGGSPLDFKTLKPEVAESLTKYIQENFSNFYKLANSIKATISDMIYWMYTGELQANSKLGSIVFDMGFTFKGNREILVSPDGKQQWDIKADINAELAKKLKTQQDKLNQQPDMFKKYFNKESNNTKGSENTDFSNKETGSYDLPKSDEVRRQITKDNKEFTKGASRDLFDEQGNIKIFYHGSNSSQIRRNSTGRGFTTWYSYSPIVADTYRKSDIGLEMTANMKGYIVNFKPNEIFKYSADFTTWDNIDNAPKTVAEIMDFVNNIASLAYDAYIQLAALNNMNVNEADKGLSLKTISNDIDKLPSGLKSKLEYMISDLMKLSGLSRIQVLKVIFTPDALNEIMNYTSMTTDKIAEYAVLHGYKAVLIEDVYDTGEDTNASPFPSTDLITFFNNTENIKKVTTNDNDVKVPLKPGYETIAEGELYEGPSNKPINDFATFHRNFDINDNNAIIDKRTGELHYKKGGKAITEDNYRVENGKVIDKETNEAVFKGLFDRAINTDKRLLSSTDYLKYTSDYLKYKGTNIPLYLSESDRKNFGILLQRYSETKNRISYFAAFNTMVQHNSPKIDQYLNKYSELLESIYSYVKKKDQEHFNTTALINDKYSDLDNWEQIKKDVKEDFHLNTKNDAVDILTLLSYINKALNIKQSEGSLEKDIGDSNKDARYISNKVARESNLKYFIKKGKPIQLDPGVRNFIISTTAEVNKLPPIIRDAIKSGTLNKQQIIDYIATASRMNEYTFKAIAENIFNNLELAKLTYNEMRKLSEHTEDLATVSYLADQLKIDANSKMTVDELLNTYQQALNKVKEDDKFADKFLKADKRSQTVKEYSGATGTSQYHEYHADPLKLNVAFFEHYDGTLNSMRDINNLGKYLESKQQAQELVENVETGELIQHTKTAWNWVDKAKKAEIDYELDEDITKTIKDIPRDEKVNTVTNYIYDTMAQRVKALSDQERRTKGPKLLAQIKKLVAEIDSLSDKDLNRRYLQVLEEQTKPVNKRGIKKVIPKTEAEMKAEPQTTKNYKDHLRNAARTLTRRIAGLKANYNILSDEVKAVIDPNNHYKIIGAKYTDLSDAEIVELTNAIRKDSDKIEAIQKTSRQKEKNKEAEQKRLIRLQERNVKLKEQLTETKQVLKETKKTMRQKVQYQYKTKVKTQNFEFVSPNEPNHIVKSLLDTTWNDRKMSNVKGVENNTEQDVVNAKTFYEVNAKLIAGASLAEVEEATKFFLDTKMNNVDDPEYRKFQALQLYFLGWVYEQSAAGKIYAGFNANLRQRVENRLKNTASGSGTLMAVWNNITKNLDVLETMKSAEMEIDGVPLTDSEKDQLFTAIKSADMEKIKAIERKITERISKERTSKKSLLRKITTIRSMAMLSSPVTWLRNIVSNFAVKRINKLASTIGGSLWKGKTVAGQLKMNKQVTPEIQKFINDNFLDNGLFDELVGNLSKYNPSDIARKFKNADGTINKEAIMAQMVIKSMYNQYYNENLFKTKWMNSVHQMLMKALSDNNYVREATVRYFGKIIAEKGYNLSKNEVSDAIMNDFAMASGLALADYMHQDNIMHQIENLITEKAGEGGLFLWKTILPFASASWQWFKAAIKLSPIGLARSIVNMARLESRVAKVQAQWEQGKSQISPELAEYIARRDLGQGVIGTIAWGLGALLAGFGFIRLEDDDYGNPKIYIGNLKIDVSAIFGSSSLLAGAALITGFTDKGLTLDGLLAGLNRMGDVFIDDFFLMDIVQMDMYGESVFDMMTNNLESIALSFIPNILSWLAGITYSGTLRKSTLLDKAMAKIPFLGNFVPKKVNPYTGESNSWWDAINRFVPYLSYTPRSKSEKQSKQLGLNKSELTGRYTINDESFTLSNKELTTINEAYGKWNAKDLADFYNNKLSIQLKVGDKYKTLRYNQMTDEQRKTAVQKLMNKNSNYAKIFAWLKAGNKYYASDDEYQILRKLGVTGKLYRGTKGFVKAN